MAILTCYIPPCVSDDRVNQESNQDKDHDIWEHTMYYICIFFLSFCGWKPGGDFLWEEREICTALHGIARHWNGLDWN